MTATASMPDVILWEITYACPLRCVHCYTESGRRPARTLDRARQRALTDVLAAMKPRMVHLGGGEPLIVDGVLEVAERLRTAGVPVVLSTSGFGLDAALAREVARLFHSVHVSIDGPDALIHDRIRGRAGSFDESVAALAHLDELQRAGGVGGGRQQLGIDCTLVRSNFDHIRRVVTELAPRFDALDFVLFNAAIPNGLASRESYEPELLTDAQLALLTDDDFAAGLQAVAPGNVLVSLTDNTDLQMHPDRVRDGTAAVDFMAVEPDGQVRALPIYEGVVGSLLDEPPAEVWRRVAERRVHPYVVEQLGSIRSMHDWAVATRNLNARFATPADLVRIRARKPYQPDANS